MIFIPTVFGFLYILCSMLVAYFGRHRKWGFWGYFFASLLMSPAVGLLFLLAGETSRRPKRAF